MARKDARATTQSVFHTCDQLEATQPGQWTIQDVLAVTGGSLSTLGPLVALWRDMQEIRQEAVHTPSALVHAILQAVDPLLADLRKRLDDRLQSLDDTYQRRLDECLKAAESAESMIEDLRGRVTDRDTRIEALIEDAHKKDQKISSQIAQLQAAEEKRIALVAELDRKADQLQEKENALSQAREQYQHALLQVEAEADRRHRETVQQHEHEQNRLMKLLDDARQMAKTDLASAEQKLKDQTQQHKEELHQVQTQLNKANQQITALQTRQEMNQEQLAELKSLLKKSEDEKDKLHGQLDETRETISNLSAQLTSQRTYLDENARLREQIEQLQKMIKQ